MTAAELSNVVSSILFLIVLSLIFFKWWPEQRVDLFRQQMFALRDELFDFALGGHVEFSEPAYMLLRNLMNGTIRYAHNLTPYRTAMSVLRWKCTFNAPSNSWNTAWENSLKKVSDNEARARLEGFHSKATMLVVSQLVLSPGLVVFMLPIFIPYSILYRPMVTLRDIYVSIRNTIPVTLLEEEAVKS